MHPQKSWATQVIKDTDDFWLIKCLMCFECDTAAANIWLSMGQEVGGCIYSRQSGRLEHLKRCDSLQPS